MNIYDELTVIDNFEEKSGNSVAVTRACDFMVAYLGKMTRPLPEIATRGLRSAMKHGQGLAKPGELEAERKLIADFLRQRSDMIDTPEHCIMRAVEAILICYQHPVWGGGASELVSNFLDMTEKFESNHELIKQLLKEYFPQRRDTLEGGSSGV